MLPQGDLLTAIPIDDVKRDQQRSRCCDCRPAQQGAETCEQSMPMRLCENCPKAEYDQARARVDRLDVAQPGGELADSDQQRENAEESQGSCFGAQEKQAGKNQIEEHLEIQA